MYTCTCTCTYYLLLSSSLVHVHVSFPLSPSCIVSSNSDTLIAKELRECLREASLSRPPIKTVRRSESPSAHSLSSTGTRGSRGSPASSKPTLSATPTSNLKGGRFHFVYYSCVHVCTVCVCYFRMYLQYNYYHNSLVKCAVIS